MSSDDVAISVRNLSKCYEIFAAPRDRLKQFVLPPLQRLMGRPPEQYFREFWALRDVSFDVRRGETIGIIGRNGCGKSTLLQAICGIVNATSGGVRVNGRVAALLELGAGFNPDFTGRENVRLSCALLGLSAEETDARLDDILAFADIGDFIDQPVKTYSSGMYVRLAFAVNIVSDPDIMIVDEALAVGDMAFQAKCMTALTRIQQAGATVLFVSHDISAVRSLCSRAIYLEHGQVKAIGRAAEVASAYVRTMREEMADEARQSAPRQAIATAQAVTCQAAAVPGAEIFKRSEDFDGRTKAFRYGAGGARIAYAEMLDSQGQPVSVVEFGQEVSILIYVESAIDADLTCNYYVTDHKKNFIVGCDPRLAGHDFLAARAGGRYLLSYTTRLPLKVGNYSIDLELAKPIIVDEQGEFLDVIDNAIVFQVMRRPRAQLWAQLYVENKYHCLEV